MLKIGKFTRNCDLYGMVGNILICAFVSVCGWYLPHTKGKYLDEQTNNNNNIVELFQILIVKIL